ncbi:MAG: PDZ domain-containing protein [Flavobacteriales bacterium]|nr:PDZ domain-containing protein [Flavobacteriales bacterium]
MKKIYLLKFAVVLVVAAFCSPYVLGQSKAHIYIKRNQDGKMIEETRELDVADGQDIESLLREMGVLDEFGKLKDGQSFEITIDKFENGSHMQDFQLRFMQEPPLPLLPPLPPIPPSAARQSNQPFLGVMLKETAATNSIEEGSSGTLISEVIEGSAAEKAGLLAGDIILEINRVEMPHAENVIEYIGAKEPGDEIKIEVMRGSQVKKIKAELGIRTFDSMKMFGDGNPTQMEEFRQLENLKEVLPGWNFTFHPDSIAVFCPDNQKLKVDSFMICQPFNWNEEGFELKETPFLGVTPGDEDDAPGVFIGSVVEGSSAQKMGFEEGDVIINFNGTGVNNFDELADQIGTTEAGSVVKIEFLRDGKSKVANGEIGSRSVSAFKDFRIFHDFKGMDEDGNYNYDYEFDLDSEDLEKHIEELIIQLDEEKMELNSELDRIRSEREMIIIKIEIDNITAQEADMANEKASPKIEIDNDLVFEQITFFPNPGNGIVNLNFNLMSNGNLSVVLYDSKGNKVYMEERGAFTGAYTNVIDISEKADGTYYLQIMQGGKSYSKKVVKGE